jgi:biopolymer transport protein ExbB
MSFSLESSLLSILRDAGWPIWLLLTTSVLCLALIFERLLTLRRGHIVPPTLVDQVIDMVRNRQDSPEALSYLEHHSSLGQVLAEVVRHRHLAKEELRRATEDIGRAVSHQLNRYVGAIGTIAVVAPLLGLFGTVMGMIEIFSAYSPTGGDPIALAHGISVALYNTGFGILIAILATIFHRYLRSRIEHYTHLMEQAATTTIRSLSAITVETRDRV